MCRQIWIYANISNATIMRENKISGLYYKSYKYKNKEVFLEFIRA